MRKCLGLRGIRKKVHLISSNAINLGTFQSVQFSSPHVWIQFIPWPRGLESLSLARSLFHHQKWYAEVESNISILRREKRATSTSTCSAETEFIKLILMGDHCVSSQCIKQINKISWCCRTNNCRDWPKNPLRILLLAELSDILQIKPTGYCVETRQKCNFQCHQLMSHTANECLILRKCNKQIWATIALRPKNLLWP